MAPKACVGERERRGAARALPDEATQGGRPAASMRASEQGAHLELEVLCRLGGLRLHHDELVVSEAREQRQCHVHGANTRGNVILANEQHDRAGSKRDDDLHRRIVHVARHGQTDANLLTDAFNGAHQRAHDGQRGFSGDAKRLQTSTGSPASLLSPLGRLLGRLCRVCEPCQPSHWSVNSSSARRREPKQFVPGGFKVQTYSTSPMWDAILVDLFPKSRVTPPPSYI